MVGLVSLDLPYTGRIGWIEWRTKNGKWRMQNAQFESRNILHFSFFISHSSFELTRNGIEHQDEDRHEDANGFRPDSGCPGDVRR